MTSQQTRVSARPSASEGATGDATPTVTRFEQTDGDSSPPVSRRTKQNGPPAPEHSALPKTARHSQASLSLSSLPQWMPAAAQSSDRPIYPLLDDPGFAEVSYDYLDSFDGDDGALPPIDVPVTTVAVRTKLTREQALAKVAEARARVAKNRAAHF